MVMYEVTVMNTMTTISPKYQKRIIELCDQVNWDYRVLNFVKEPVGGTNTSFFVSYKDEGYVLRIASNNSYFLRIDRKAEASATKIASDNRIGLQLYFFNEQNGDMITRFSSGHLPTVNELKEIKNLDKLVAQLKKLHSNHIEHIFEPTTDIERRANRISEFQILRNRKAYIRAMELYIAIKDKFPPYEPKYWGLCHNDPSNFNMLLGEDLKLIDYEFAGMGNVFYDVACICGLWNEKEQIHFLNRYFGSAKKIYFEYIKYYTILELIWNGTWAYIKDLEENLIAINYLDWADEQFGLALNLGYANGLL